MEYTALMLASPLIAIAVASFFIQLICLDTPRRKPERSSEVVYAGVSSTYGVDITLRGDANAHDAILLGNVQVLHVTNKHGSWVEVVRYCNCRFGRKIRARVVYLASQVESIVPMVED